MGANGSGVIINTPSKTKNIEILLKYSSVRLIAIALIAILLY